MWEQRRGEATGGRSARSGSLSGSAADRSSGPGSRLGSESHSRRRDPIAKAGSGLSSMGQLLFGGPLPLGFEQTWSRRRLRGRSLASPFQPRWFPNVGRESGSRLRPTFDVRTQSTSSSVPRGRLVTSFRAFEPAALRALPWGQRFDADRRRHRAYCRKRCPRGNRSPVTSLHGRRRSRIVARNRAPAGQLPRPAAS